MYCIFLYFITKYRYRDISSISYRNRKSDIEASLVHLNFTYVIYGKLSCDEEVVVYIVKFVNFIVIFWLQLNARKCLKLQLHC